MRMLLGGVSLLVVLAIVGLLAKVQLRSADTPDAAGVVTPEPASAVEIDPALAATPTHDLPGKVQDDLTRAMQAAPARADESR